MRYLYIDVDTLLPLHRGCYHRNITPNIDKLGDVYGNTQKM